ncbi:MAG: lysophospholipid acyltransferase family protein [Pseudomonadota bacterium]
MDGTLRQDSMHDDPDSGQKTPLAPEPFWKRLPKRVLLLVLGPFYFLYIAFVPLLCSHKSGFRGWYWRVVKRACSNLLTLLSIRVDIPAAQKRALAEDTDSVFVMNHRSHLDGFLLMDIVPDEKWFTFAAKKELCDARLLSTGFKAAGLVEIDRASGKVAMETLSKAVREMPRRRSVVLFPEGTRAKTASLAPFKAGAVLVARETGRTIRPIVIHDSDRLLPRGKFVPKAGTVRVEVLPSFACDPSLSIDQDVARLHAAMESAFSDR